MNFSLIGRSLLNLVATSEVMGHSKPQNTIEYLHGELLPEVQLAADIISWCAGDTEAEIRVRKYLNETGYLREHLDTHCKSLT